jgi:hypothetical protein
MRSLFVFPLLIAWLAQPAFAGRELQVVHFHSRAARGNPESVPVRGKARNGSYQVNLDARDKLFRSIGIAESIKGMDELEKNVLILRAEEKNAKELARLYPNLPEEKLSALARELKQK